MGVRTDNDDDTRTLTVEAPAPTVGAGPRTDTPLPAETEGESVITITAERPARSDLLPADAEPSTLEPREPQSEEDDATRAASHTVDAAMVAAVRASLAAELDDATATSIDVGALAAKPDVERDGDEVATSIDSDSARRVLFRAQLSSLDEKTDARGPEDILAPDTSESAGHAGAAARTQQSITLASAVLATDPDMMPAGLSRLLTTRAALAEAASSGLAFDQTDPTNRTLAMPRPHGVGNPAPVRPSTEPLAVRLARAGLTGPPPPPPPPPPLSPPRSTRAPVAFMGAPEAPQSMPRREAKTLAWSIAVGLVLGAVVVAVVLVLVTTFVAGRPARGRDEASPVPVANDAGQSSPPARPPVRSPAPKGSTPIRP